MKLLGSRQSVCFSGWLMAALVLLGLNGFHLMALENQQIVGHSPAIKTLRANLIQWENSMKARAMPDGGYPFEPLQIRYSEAQPRDTAPSPPKSAEAVPAAPPEAVNLPVVRGVLRTVDRRGRETYLAVLDGQVCQPDDRIDAFVVREVSRKGVLLEGQGQQWYLECPAPAYSENRGD